MDNETKRQVVAILGELRDGLFAARRAEPDPTTIRYDALGIACRELVGLINRVNGWK
jgi:hypothetical protein